MIIENVFGFLRFENTKKKEFSFGSVKIILFHGKFLFG
jgi:hypothetical protein